MTSLFEGVFSHNTATAFLRALMARLKARGKGQIQELARALRVQPSYLSQMANGTRILTAEQAILLGRFGKATPEELDYLLAIAQVERAGNHELKAYYVSLRDDLRAKAKEVRQRVLPKGKLPLEEAVIFYSDPLYSATHLILETRKSWDADALAQRLKVNPKRMGEVLDFLVRNGFCTNKDGLFRYRPFNTHVDSNDPLCRVHHLNWRAKAMERLGAPRGPSEISFTAPLTLSREDAKRVKEMLLRCISDVANLVNDSPAEKLSVLCIDFLDEE